MISANPCGMGKITPLAGVEWPMWIGPLSSQVARVVWEVSLKGLLGWGTLFMAVFILHDLVIFYKNVLVVITQCSPQFLCSVTKSFNHLKNSPHQTLLANSMCLNPQVKMVDILRYLPTSVGYCCQIWVVSVCVVI